VSFLLAKMAALMLVAMASGGLVTRWWIFRRYEDVTADYGRLDRAWRGWRLALQDDATRRAAARRASALPRRSGAPPVPRAHVARRPQRNGAD